jgi:hypothetical protein
MAHAAAAAVKAGTDLEWLRQRTSLSSLVDAVHQNLITEAELDTALRHYSPHGSVSECSIHLPATLTV